MKIYLEFVEGASSKFWTVEVDGERHTVTYGRIGSDGQSKTKSFGTEDEANADAEKQAAKKRKKGYVDVEPGATGGSSPKAAAKTKKATAKPAGKSDGKSPKKASVKPAKAKAPSARTLKSFFKAMREGNLDRVTAELDRAIDPNTQFDIQGDDEPWSLLYHAVFHRQDEVANCLLDRGATASFGTAGGSSPLHHVRGAALTERLIAAGADPNTASSHGARPLHCTDDVEVARVLLDAGAEVDAEYKGGGTPYERTTDVAMRALLLERGSRGLLATEGVPYPVDSETVSFDKVDASRGAMGLDHEGALWFCGYAGFFRVTDEVVRYMPPGSPAVDAVASAHGVVYLATNQGLLAFRDGKFRQYTPNDSPLHDGHITGMFIVDDEVYLIGYESGAKAKHVSVFDGESWRLLRPGHELPEKCDVHGVMRDAAGRLVLADREDGGIYTLTGDSWVRDDLGKRTFTPKVYVMASHEGVDYFGTHSGLLRRPEGGELEEVLDGAFGELTWVGDTLWAATKWDGIHALGPSGAEHYDEERAGSSLGNVEGMFAAPDGRLFLLAGNTLLVVQDGSFSEVTERPKFDASAYEHERRPLPETPFVSADALPTEWVKTVRDANLGELEPEALLCLTRPAIGVALADGADQPGGASRIGGEPDLPKKVEWPRYPDEDDHLPFVMQFDCAALSVLDLEGLLPKKGMLYVFSDTRGDDDDPASHILYAAKPGPRRATPADLEARRSVKDVAAVLEERPLRFFTQFTLPSGEWLEGVADLDDDAQEAIRSLREALSAATEWSSTQLLGWAEPVQGDVFGDGSDVVLLQLERLVEDLGDWITDGLRYWMIDEAALQERTFDDVWHEYQYT